MSKKPTTKCWTCGQPLHPEAIALGLDYCRRHQNERAQADAEFNRQLQIAHDETRRAMFIDWLMAKYPDWENEVDALNAKDDL